MNGSIFPTAPASVGGLVLALAPENLVAEGRYGDAHQRRENVEETEGEVHEGWHAEHGALRHAAGVPRHEHGGDGHGVLGGAAEQPPLVALTVVDVAEHVARQQYAQVLVGDGDVEHETRGGGAAHERRAPLDEVDEQSCDAAHHACSRHGAAEAHGADNEPDGGHHAAHAACGHEVGEHGAVGVDSRLAVEAHHRRLEERRVNLLQHAALEHRPCRHGHEGGEEERYHGRRAPRYEHTCEHWHCEQPRCHVEPCAESLGEGGDVLRAAGAAEQTDYGEEHERNGHGRHCGDEHVANVLEERHAEAARGQGGGLAQGRNLVAEIGSADYGSCHQPVAEPLRPSDAHEGNADGGDGGPGRAGHHAHQRANHAGRGEEDVGMDDLQSVVDECRHHAADHPRPAQCADEQQYHQRARHAGHVFRYGLLKARPRHVEPPHADQHAEGRHRQQRYLRGSAQRVAAERLYRHGEHGHQHHQRH